MPFTKKQKQNIITDLEEKLSRQKSVVFVAVDGLKAKDLFALRKQLKAANCLIIVVKKTLLNLALRAKGIQVQDSDLKGQVALVFGFSDEVTPAKIANQFATMNQNFKILGGFIESQFRSMGEVITFANIPSREILLARLVGNIASPLSGLVVVLQGSIRNLVYTLQQIKN